MLRRRRLLFVFVLVLVFGAAVAVSLSQKPLYEATAKVLLSRQNLANSLTGTPDATLQTSQVGDFTRYAATQAEVAHSMVVAQRVLTRVGLTDRTPRRLLRQTTVTPSADTDILEFSVTDDERSVAQRLTSAFAQQYTQYRLQLDTNALAQARDEVSARIASLDANGQGRSGGLYGSLVSKRQQLETLEALQTANTSVLPSSTRASQVQPRPLRSGALGLAVGLILALAAVYARDAFDTRTWTTEEVEQTLRSALLAQLPAPPRRVQTQMGIVSVEDPNSFSAEAFRGLRTALSFETVIAGAKVVMITSSIEGEGKSTTAANLAVSLARGGQRTIIVDADFRRPSLHRFFGLDAVAGATDAALGHSSVEDLLHVAPIGPDGETTADALVPGGNLRVLTVGTLPPNPGEFAGTPRLHDLLRSLAEDADVVIVDTSPIVPVSDALEMCTAIDAIVFVAKVRTVQHAQLREARRLLDGVGAKLAGFVATGVEGDFTGYGSYYRAHASEKRWPARRSRGTGGVESLPVMNVRSNETANGATGTDAAPATESSPQRSVRG